jgi:hypothetical protein
VQRDLEGNIHSLHATNKEQRHDTTHGIRQCSAS